MTTAHDAGHPSSGHDWWQSSVIYQIYPRSFSDSNGDGVGDLPGVTQRLDYLADLGVDAIWLSPFFESPMADNGYDISDHCRVDPVFGTNEDAEALIAAAHERGMRVLLDIVLGHTSDQHQWFEQSSASRDAEKRDWYVWRDGPTPGSPDGGPPNNWQAGFPPGASTWTWHEPTRQWYLHSHLPQQPDLDWTNPHVRHAQLDVLRWWLDRGVDGIRLDSINRLGKDPELRDNIQGDTLRQQDWPSTHAYLREVRALVNRYPGVMTVGEVWEFDQRRIMPYLAVDELHLAHNFVFVRLPFDARLFTDTVDEFQALAGDHVWPAWFLNNHDEPRVVSRWAVPHEEPRIGQSRARVAAVLLLTLRGTPFLYQGEELGLPDTLLGPGVGQDLNGRDPQRTPMPWAPPSGVGAGAGFTDGTPWLPIGESAETINVASQRGSAGSTLALYRALLRLRRTRPSLSTGDQHTLQAPEGVMAFVRTLEDERTLVTLNFTSEAVSLASLREQVSGAGVGILVSSDETSPATRSLDEAWVPPLTGIVWLLKDRVAALPQDDVSRTQT